MKDDNADKPAEFEEELQLWYRAQIQEHPSAEIDDAIIKQAKVSALKTGTDDLVVIESHFWRRHRWPLSSVASVMLVATLLLINQDITQDTLSDEVYAPALMQMRSLQREGSSSQSDTKPTLMQVNSGVQEQQVQASAELNRTQFKSMKMNTINRVEQQSSDTLTSISRSQFSHIEPSKVESRKVTTDPASENIQANVESLSDNQPIKSMPQREAVVSAKQVLNHLENLVNKEQWTEAEKLLRKIPKMHPELKNKLHPQYVRWKILSEQVIISVSNSDELITDK